MSSLALHRFDASNSSVGGNYPLRYMSNYSCDNTSADENDDGGYIVWLGDSTVLDPSVCEPSYRRTKDVGVRAPYHLPLDSLHDADARASDGLPWTALWSDDCSALSGSMDDAEWRLLRPRASGDDNDAPVFFPRGSWWPRYHALIFFPQSFAGSQETSIEIEWIPPDDDGSGLLKLERDRSDRTLVYSISCSF